MPPYDHRRELARLLKQIGVPAEEADIKLIELDEIKQAFIWRCEHRAKSPRIGAVVSQLLALADAARRACSGWEVTLPDEILPATFDALTGRYPFSNIDLAPVTTHTLANPERLAGLYRTAVIDASVAPHVANAALRQLPDEPHLVAVRSIAFPFAAAREYFLRNLPEAEPADLRKRLRDIILYDPDVAFAMLKRVHERVFRATRDPVCENPGRRTLYDWAEPAPVARLVIDVIDLVLAPAVERPRTAVQKRVAEIIDQLIDDPSSNCVRQDVIGSMLTIWLARNQHLAVEERLSGMLHGRPGRPEGVHQRLRRSFWWASRAVVMDSLDEVSRRARMGDHHHVSQLRSRPQQRRGKRGAAFAPRARATGLPVVTPDLAAAAGAEADVQFLLKLARACKPWLRAG